MMPWSIEPGHSECGEGRFAVVQDDTGEVAGCHDTRESARRQQRALYASESPDQRQRASEPNLDTPDAGDLNTAAREQLARQGKAMPDGSYPIRNRADLDKAVNAVGRGGGSHDAIRRHIIKRARALGLTEMIPDNWDSDGGLKGRAAKQPVESHIPRGRLVLRAAQVHGVDFEERIISLVAVPYGQETVVQDRDDRRPVREVVERGAFRGIETRGDDVTVNRDHDYGRTIGKVVSYRSDEPAGLVSDVYVSDTPLGDESLRLAADGILKASVAMAVRRSDMTVRNGLRRIHRAFLDHIALLPNPAYKGARVLAVRQEPDLPAADEGQPSTPNLDAVLNSPIGEYLDRLRSRR